MALDGAGPDGAALDGAGSGGAARADAGLTPEVRARFRALLVADRASTLKLIADLDRGIAAIADARRDSNNDDEHDPEGATLAFERSQADALATQSAVRLTEIDAAIARLDDGVYGICEVCERPIAKGRLQARPSARRCIDCA